MEGVEERQDRGNLGILERRERLVRGWRKRGDERAKKGGRRGRLTGVGAVAGT